MVYATQRQERREGKQSSVVEEKKAIDLGMNLEIPFSQIASQANRQVT